MTGKSFIYFFIDLKNSRSFASQQITNQLMTSLADFLNQKLQASLLTPFAVREGDALIGGGQQMELLLETYDQCLTWYYSENLAQFLKKISQTKEAISLYFGVGIGDVTTSLELSSDIEQINGTAIRYAKEAMETAKAINNEIPADANKKSDDYAFLMQPFKFFAKTSEANELGQVLNGMMYLTYEALIHNDNQNQLFFIKEHYPELANHAIAEKLGYQFDPENQKERYVMSSRVSRLLTTSYYKLYQKAKKDLRNYLLFLEGETS